MIAMARVLTIQVALDAEVAEIDPRIATPNIVDITEALMLNAPFSDHVIGVSLMAVSARPMDAAEFRVALSTEGKTYNEQN